MEGTAGQPCRRRHRAVGLAVAAFTALAALTLAACGSTSGSGPAGNTSTTATGGTSAPTGSTEAPSGPAATTAVGRAYEVLFDLANPTVAPKLAVVQDGSALSATIAQELRSPIARAAAGATVSSVVVEPAASCSQAGLPSPCASVRYSVVGANHKALLSNSKGYAVYLGGRWLVAKETICGLLSLAIGGGAEPNGC